MLVYIPLLCTDRTVFRGLAGVLFALEAAFLGVDVVVPESGVSQENSSEL